MALTICGRSRESLPIVLKTKSCNLFTVVSKSSPNDAILSGVNELTSAFYSTREVKVDPQNEVKKK